MNMFSLAFSLFLLMDSIGNIPLYLSILKNVPPERHKYIILREMLIALLVIILFTFLGDGLMNFLAITESTLEIAGGLILFLICLKMIFPTKETSQEDMSPNNEPLVVPLAVPFVAGPAILTTIIIYSKQSIDYSILVGGILIAWTASSIVLLASPYLKQLLGTKGIIALERIMGLILILISVQMFLNGLKKFLTS